MAEIKRQTAYKQTIANILNAEYVVLDGWDPNYVIIDGIKISRVNVIGIVVGKSPNGDSIIVDDKTGQISVRNFEGRLFDDFSLGDIVMIIGKPRQYNDQKYIANEIVKKIKPEWITFRKKETNVLNNLLKKNKSPESAKTQKKIEKEENNENIFLDEEIIEEPKTLTQKITDFIQKNDAGSGVEIDSILKRFGDCEEIINNMIKKGEIFENRAGRVKVL